MTHLEPHEALVRELFTALVEHDLATLQILLCPRVVLHVPGQHPVAGEYQGYAGLLDFWSKLSRRAAGNLELRLEEVLAKADLATALCTDWAEREGKHLESRVVYVLRLEEGRIAEVWIHNYDQYAVDAFWN
jgi:ketosteroid isomerase-like protein